MLGRDLRLEVLQGRRTPLGRLGAQKCLPVAARRALEIGEEGQRERFLLTRLQLSGEVNGAGDLFQTQMRCGERVVLLAIFRIEQLLREVRRLLPHGLPGTRLDPANTLRIVQDVRSFQRGRGAGQPVSPVPREGDVVIFEKVALTAEIDPRPHMRRGGTFDRLVTVTQAQQTDWSPSSAKQK